jgi:hypothetical protein
MESTIKNRGGSSLYVRSGIKAGRITTNHSRRLLLALRRLGRGALVVSCIASGCAFGAEAPEDKSETATSGALLSSQRYDVIELPFIPSGINDRGVVVGTALGIIGVTYQDGITTALPRNPNAPADVCLPTAISARGAVVGWSYNPLAPLLGQGGLFWPEPDRSPIQIGAGKRGVTPVAINSSNMVVGTFQLWASPTAVHTHIFRWTPNDNRFTDVTPDEVYVVAGGLNDAGFIVGSVQTPEGHLKAIRWSPTGVATALSTAPSQAVDINNAGDAVGMVGPRFDSMVRWPPLVSIGKIRPVQRQLPLNDLIVGLVTDLSNTGQTVGVPLSGPQFPRPFTTLNGTTSFPPVPDPVYDLNESVTDLRVNSCGSIIGIHNAPRSTPTGAFTKIGLLWREKSLDGIRCEDQVVVTP